MNSRLRRKQKEKTERENRRLKAKRCLKGKNINKARVGG